MIPQGQFLYVDVEETAKLNLVMVFGALLFFPNEADHLYHQKAHFNHIMVARGGRMQVGTDEQPFTSKLTITMYGTKRSAEIL